MINPQQELSRIDKTQSLWVIFLYGVFTLFVHIAIIIFGYVVIPLDTQELTKIIMFCYPFMLLLSVGVYITFQDDWHYLFLKRKDNLYQANATDENDLSVFFSNILSSQNIAFQDNYRERISIVLGPTSSLYPKPRIRELSIIRLQDTQVALNSQQRAHLILMLCPGGGSWGLVEYQLLHLLIPLKSLSAHDRMKLAHQTQNNLASSRCRS